MYILYILVIYSTLLISYCLSLISIPFKSININNEKYSNFFKEALSNDIYINLTLSNTPKNSNNIKTILKINKNSIYIPYNNLSSTKIIDKDRWVYATWAFSLLNYANDSFSFNILNNVINDKNFSKSNSKGTINFLTKKGLNSNEINDNFGMIGLKLISNENETKYPDFIKELKREKIIENYEWSIKYNYINRNNYEGEFLIGKEIEKYYKNNIKDNDEFRMVKAFNRKYELYWDIKLKEIVIGDHILDVQSKYSLQATFEPKINLIIGTTDFRNTILNRFFNNYIYKRICFEEAISFSVYDYIGITCRKPFNISEFPYIYFRLQFYSFSFSGQDLFFEDSDNYHFLIIFNRESYIEGQNNEFWTFGIPFMNKYILIFNNDHKTINYYRKHVLSKSIIKKENEKNDNNDNIDKNDKNDEINNDNDNEGINKENNNINNNELKNSKIYIFIIIGIIIGCILLILLGMKIQTMVIKKRFPTLNLNGRKKHKNELSCELEQMNKDNNLLTS